MKQRGFTLIELMITIAVLAILMMIAAANFSDYAEKARIKGFAENLSSDLRYAQNEARASKQNVCLEFATGTEWSYSFRQVQKNAACGSGGSILKSKSFSDIRNSTISSVKVNNVDYSNTNIPKYDGQKGKISGYLPININLESSGDKQYQINLIVNPIGLITSCSPNGSSYVGGFNKC